MRKQSAMLMIVHSLPEVPPGFNPFGSAHEVAKGHVRATEIGAPGERFLDLVPGIS